MTDRCPICARKVRRRIGDYDLCRRCASALEAEIEAWVGKLDEDLSTLERFDAYCASRNVRLLRSSAAP